MELKIGQQAPEFALPDQDGAVHRLSDYRGRWVVLYFYPKDDTPGCTAEACSMRDNLPHFEQMNAVILGVSVDSVGSHKKFAEKYSLPFTLLADEQKKVVEQYGVWGEKKFMGKTYLGINRTTFVINPDGDIVKIYERVEPEVHAQQVTEELRQLAS